MQITSRWGLFISYFLLAIDLWWLLLSNGGIYPSGRAVGFIVIALLLLILPPERGHRVAQRAIPKSIGIPTLILICIVSFQLLPLPPVAVAALSPHRAALARDAVTATGSRAWTALSLDPDMTVLELTTGLGCLSILLLMRRYSQAFGSGWLSLSVILLPGVVESIYGLQQAANPNGPATATGTFLNRNHFAGFLELLVPLALTAAWSVLQTGAAKTWRQHLVVVFWMVTSLLFVLAVFYTYSRMGLAVVVFEICMVAGLILWAQRLTSYREICKIVAILVVLTVPGILLLPKRLTSRMENSSAMDRESTALRLGFWRDSLRIAKDYPLTGCGLGAFEAVYPNYQTAGLGYRVEYLHNDFFQSLVELGIPAFALLLFLIVSICVELLRHIRHARSLQAQLVGVGTLSSLAAILLHSTVDFNLHIPVNAMTLACILGWGLIREA